MPGEAPGCRRAQWRQSLTGMQLREACGTTYGKNAFYRAQCEGCRPPVIDGYHDLHGFRCCPVGMFRTDWGACPADRRSLADIETEISLDRDQWSAVSRPPRRIDDDPRLNRNPHGGYRDFFGISNGRGCSCACRRRRFPRWGMVRCVQPAYRNAGRSPLSRARIFLHPQDALAYLRRWEGAMTRHIIGPPFIVARFVRVPRTEEIPLALDGVDDHHARRMEAARSPISRDEFNDKAERLAVNAPDQGHVRNDRDATSRAGRRARPSALMYPWSRHRECTNSAWARPAVPRSPMPSTPPIRASCPMTSAEVDDVTRPCGRTGQTARFRRRRQGPNSAAAVSIERHPGLQSTRARVRTRGHPRDGLTRWRGSVRRSSTTSPAPASCGRLPKRRCRGLRREVRVRETRFCSAPDRRGCRERHRLRGIRLFGIAGHRVDTHRAA